MGKVKIGVRERIRLQEVANGRFALAAFMPKTTESLLQKGYLEKSLSKVRITDLGKAELARTV